LIAFAAGGLFGFLVGAGFVISLGWGLAETFGRRKR
jgi:hypothetical protein